MTLRSRAARLAGMAREERRLWPTRMALRHDLSPPPPEAYAAFGDGAVIVPPARVNNPDCIEIGEQTVLLEGAWLAVYPQDGMPRPRLRIGARTRIGRSCHIACVGSVSIGAEVLTADHVFIADTYHGFEQFGVPIMRQPMAPPKPVVVERGAFLGIRSVVLQGVTVGENAYVGAGAVVDRSVPARTVVVGNPATPVRTWDASTQAWRTVRGWDDLGDRG
jgi:acetyltransferase-like isoleucine patch superfamily enzyme